ncbi:unnamed protein product [Boreogadus saida]
MLLAHFGPIRASLPIFSFEDPSGLSITGYAMVSAAHPDLQVLVSLSCVFGLVYLCSTAEAAVIPLVASAP